MLKKYICILWLVLLFAIPTTQAENKVTFTDPAKVIVVKKNGRNFDIILQSNPTTGYSWSIKNYESNLITPLGRKFFPPINKKLMGAPGYEKWSFRVKPAGFIVPHLTSVTLIYHRPWDEQGAQVVNFKVVTSNAD